MIKDGFEMANTNFAMMTYGQIVLCTGVVLVVVSIIFLIAGVFFFSIKRRKLKRQLMDKYGF